ncbi:MAG TPA: acetate/propionate family kinase [Candidatus Limnocylindrales bacterium]|nr:acetate/propionate family kinase [Candidatus Limnocylindrales bacterium]
MTVERVLVVNAGSSTLKLSVVDRAGRPAAARTLETLQGSLAPKTVAAEIAALGPVDAVGHRVVHGGTAFSGPTIVDGGVLSRLHALASLAPLHQPRSLGALETVRAAMPDVPHVACFDTAFHATLSRAASTYAIPREWREKWPLRRFGFHGLSHASASRRAAELIGRPLGELRIVTCHLGAGASLAAVAGGRSVDTTMGFTPLEGLVMATRSGSVDPGLVLWVQAEGGLSASEVSDGLEHDSGLVGLAGTADMRGVLSRAAAGDGDAALALDVYVHRVRAGIAAMAASMGGMDAVAFTGGVGEHAPEVRRRAFDGLGFLGALIDAERNDAAQADAVIGLAGARVAVVVVEAREDVEIARQARELLEERP